jgi:hypothetical protein
MLSRAFIGSEEDEDEEESDDNGPPSPIPTASRAHRPLRRDSVGRLHYFATPAKLKRIPEVEMPYGPHLPPAPFFPEFANPTGNIVTPSRRPTVPNEATSPASPFVPQARDVNVAISDNDMRYFRDEMKSRGATLTSFLNALTTTEDAEIKAEFGNWLKGRGVEKYLERWTGGDRWALKRMKETLKKEVKKAERSGKFSLPRSKFTNEVAAKLNLEEARKDTQETMPSATALLGVLIGIDRKKRKRTSNASNTTANASTRVEAEGDEDDGADDVDIGEESSCEPEMEDLLEEGLEGLTAEDKALLRRYRSKEDVSSPLHVPFVSQLKRSNVR